MWRVKGVVRGGAVGADAEEEIAGFGLADVGRGDLRVFYKSL